MYWNLLVSKRERYDIFVLLKNSIETHRIRGGFGAFEVMKFSFKKGTSIKW